MLTSRYANNVLLLGGCQVYLFHGRKLGHCLMLFDDMRGRTWGRGNHVIMTVKVLPLPLCVHVCLRLLHAIRLCSYHQLFVFGEYVSQLQSHAMVKVSPWPQAIGGGVPKDRESEQRIGPTLQVRKNVV